MRAHCKSSKGFSAVELLAVGALLIVLVAVAAPSFTRAMEWYRLQSSANLVASEMEAARVLAVSRGATYQLRFDQAASTVSIIDVADPTHPPRVPKRLERGVDLYLPVSDVIFYPRGHAASSATVTVSNNQGAMAIQLFVSGKVSVAACSKPTGPGTGAGGNPPGGDGSTGGGDVDSGAGGGEADQGTILP